MVLNKISGKIAVFDVVWMSNLKSLHIYIKLSIFSDTVLTEQQQQQKYNKAKKNLKSEKAFVVVVEGH